MSSRNKTDVKKLFEYWCEVDRIHETEPGNQKICGVITQSFPENYHDEKTIADIPSFAFPCEFECQSVQLYSFVLTTVDSKWRFGFCRHDPKTSTSMVIITHLPWHDTFLRLLKVLAEIRVSENEEFSKFLREIYNREIPDPGGNVKIYYSSGQNWFTFERPLQFQLPSIPENHNLNLYYNFVDPKNMIAIFASILAERRIIFTSRRVDKLSSCVQAANAFLYPMVWQHIFIPVLPMKLKDYLCAPMPYFAGVPKVVLDTMTPDELGDVVIFDCDTNNFDSPFNDVQEMPTEIVSQLKKQLSHTQDHVGDRISRIFLGVLVQLIGGYRDAVEFRDTHKKFNREKFIESRPANLRPFLAKMMELQLFQQFIEERLTMLNTGLGFTDEFELETVRYAEKLKKRGRNYDFLKNVKEKTNPAVKSAVKSVKEGSRGVKTAYKGFRSKFRDITPPSTNFNIQTPTSLSTNTQHERVERYGFGHHSAPSSPVFNKRLNSSPTPVAGNFQYASPRVIHDGAHNLRRATTAVTTTVSAGGGGGGGVGGGSLCISNSTTHMQSNGYLGVGNNGNCLTASSPTVSPASSLGLSDMNLSQELQNHPLFKTPIVNRNSQRSYQQEQTQQQHEQSKTSQHQDDHMNDLISLDVSNNSSFELEDFDPLNKNARPIPSIATNKTIHPHALITNNFLPPNQNRNNLQYPQYNYAQQQQQRTFLLLESSTMKPASSSSLCASDLPPSYKPPPPPDDDSELLRQYGLDQFKLLATETTDGNEIINNKKTNNGNIITNGMNNWTTFD